MSGWPALDATVMAVSFFNTLLLLWLGLAVLLNAERRSKGIWLAGGGLLSGAAFLIVHTAILGEGVTRVGRETALAQVVQLVERAQESKPPIQKLADRVSAVFVPTVLVIALLPAIGGGAIRLFAAEAPGPTAERLHHGSGQGDLHRPQRGIALQRGRAEGIRAHARAAPTGCGVAHD